MRFLLAAVAAVSVLSACAETEGSTTLADRAIDDRFGGGELVFTDLARIPYRIGIFDQDGLFVICAAVQNARSSVDQRVLDAMVVEVNGETLQRGMRWATRYSGGVDLNGRTAACRLTSTPIMQDAEFSVRMSQTRF